MIDSHLPRGIKLCAEDIFKVNWGVFRKCDLSKVSFGTGQLKHAEVSGNNSQQTPDTIVSTFEKSEVESLLFFKHQLI